MKITHLNKDGNATMVDISDKVETTRSATAQTVMIFNEEAYQVLKNGYVKKGDILSVAQTAGIMGAKLTSNIIPMCHPLNITSVNIAYTFNDEAQELTIQSTVKITGKTGVEMEALTSSSITALTIYDMCKAIDKGITIKETKLLSKSGGKSGDYIR
jgi:cyclic pyranopterin phosphate synthase